MQAVNAGEIPLGIIYHYYWYRDQAESGANSDNAELHYFGNQDPGAFVSVSGRRGPRRPASTPSEAQQLVDYLTGARRPAGRSPTAPRWSTPSAPACRHRPTLTPLDELDAADVDPATLNGPQVIELMQEAGLL